MPHIGAPRDTEDTDVGEGLLPEEPPSDDHVPVEELEEVREQLEELANLNEDEAVDIDD
jgi:hypothetical protein